MLKEYKQILSASECKILADAVFEKFHNGYLNMETRFTNGAKGQASITVIDSFVPKLEKYVKADYGNDIRFVNSYSRVYQKESWLKIHIDRSLLDITLSLCVYNDTEIDWPIYVSNRQVNNNRWRSDLENDLTAITSDSKPYYTDVGDAVVCLGNRNPHWRETVKFPNRRYIIQIFYHWMFVPNKQS